MDIAQHGNISNPNSWPFLDPRTGLQAIQEHTSRHLGMPNYIGHHIFQQNAVITQQQLHVPSPIGVAEQIPGTAMQITPVGLGTENGSAHLEESHARSQDGQALPEAIGSGSDEGFIETNYLNDDSASEPVASENEGQNETQQVELDSPSVGKSHPIVEIPASSVQDECVLARSELGDGNAPVNAIALEYRTPSNLTSSDTIPSSSTGDQRKADGTVVTEEPNHSGKLAPSIQDLDIVNDKNKFSDIIKALEDKGALEKFLEGLGYQKLRETDSRADGTPSVRSIASDNGQVTCQEPKCGKVFPRPCELK